VVLARQHLSQIEAPVGIAIQPVRGARNRLHRLGGSAQRVFVRPQLGDAGETVLFADAFNRAPGFVRPQGFDVWRDEWHKIYFTLAPLPGAGSLSMYIYCMPVGI